MKGKGYQGFRASISTSSASAIIDSGNGLPGRHYPLLAHGEGFALKIEDWECGFSKPKRWSQGFPQEARPRTRKAVHAAKCGCEGERGCWSEGRSRLGLTHKSDFCDLPRLHLRSARTMSWHK